MNLKLVWEAQTGKYQLGADVYSGRIRLGGVYYNSSMNREWSEEKRKAQQYMGRCSLPGYSDVTVHAPTEDEVKDKVEQMIQVWFARLEEV